jgi:ferrochelatase
VSEAFDAVVLLGFGGPATPDDVRPFLGRVLAGRPVPPQRLDEVAQHYADIGGASPFNALTERQAKGLEGALRARGHDLPVVPAYRFSAPYVDDVVRELSEKNSSRVLAVVLAAHRSSASTQRYVDAFEDAAHKHGGGMRAEYADPFFDHPLFVRSQVQLAQAALRRLGREAFDETEVIFTAHSIPQSIAKASTYVEDLALSAQAIARELGAPSWCIAYQSRSGNAAEPWLEPDVRDVLRGLPARNVSEAVIVPVGFLCDHVEILYDLDVDAAKVAREAGVRIARAAAPNDDATFIDMLVELVERKLRATQPH